MGKSNKRVSLKTNRRGTPKVKNRDSNEATGITVQEAVEKIEELLASPTSGEQSSLLAPMPVNPGPKTKKSKKKADVL